MPITKKQVDEIKKKFTSQGISTNFKQMDDYAVAEDMSGDNQVPFMLDLEANRKKVNIDWMTECDMAVYPSTNDAIKQVVFVVGEKAHDIDGFIVLNRNSWNPASGKYEDHDTTLDEARDATYNYHFRTGVDADKVKTPYEGNNLSLPYETEFTVGAKTHTIVESFKGFNGFTEKKKYDVWTVTASVPESEHCFLIGYDDLENGEFLFISMLEEKVTSVPAAHKALRPKGISKNAVRCAEFFFDPVDDEKQEELDALLNVVFNGGSQSGWTISVPDGGQALNPDSGGNHRVDYVFTENKTRDRYVMGAVSDDECRHTVLWLPVWHKVYRANEVESFGYNFD